jgi:hypothetical protein
MSRTQFYRQNKDVIDESHSILRQDFGFNTLTLNDYTDILHRAHGLYPPPTRLCVNYSDFDDSLKDNAYQPTNKTKPVDNTEQSYIMFGSMIEEDVEEDEDVELDEKQDLQTFRENAHSRLEERFMYLMEQYEGTIIFDKRFHILNVLYEIVDYKLGITQYELK